MRTWSLLGLCALLSLTIWDGVGQRQSDAMRAAGPEPASTTPGARASVMDGANFTFAPLQQYAEIVDRTLFDASRRSPAEESEDLPAAAAAELRDLVLTGVVVTPQARVAFFRDRTPGQIRVAPGDTFGKWLLADIHGEGVTLRRGAMTREITLLDADDPLRAKSAGQPALPQAGPPAGASAEAAAPGPQAPAVTAPAVIAVPPVARSEAAPAPAMRAQPGATAPRPLTRSARRALARRGSAAPGPAVGGNDNELPLR